MMALQPLICVTGFGRLNKKFFNGRQENLAFSESVLLLFKLAKIPPVNSQ